MISIFRAKGISEFADTIDPHEVFSRRFLMFLLVTYTLGDFQMCCYMKSGFAFLVAVTVYGLQFHGMVSFFDVGTAEHTAAFVLPFITG